jgi:hypothetical protein
MTTRLTPKKSKEPGTVSKTENRQPSDRAPRKTHTATGTEYPTATIVEYTDQKEPKNLYPRRIVSPIRSGPCCFTDMEEIGKPQEEGRWVFQYKRCRKCGFTLRVILREIPDAALAAELRKILANSFVRNVPE